MKDWRNYSNQKLVNPFPANFKHLSLRKTNAFYSGKFNECN